MKILPKIKGHSVCFNFHLILSANNLYTRQQNAVHPGHVRRRKSGSVLHIKERKQVK